MKTRKLLLALPAVFVFGALTGCKTDPEPITETVYEIDWSSTKFINGKTLYNLVKTDGVETINFINSSKAIEGEVCVGEDPSVDKIYAAWDSTKKDLTVRADKKIAFKNNDRAPSSGSWTYGFFEGCESLTNINFLNVNVSKTTKMSCMFSGCRNLLSLDLSNFVTSNATTMSQMFESCHNLKTLNISSFDTSNVTDMTRMFAFCKVVQELDLSKFNTEKVTSMTQMFAEAKAIVSLDLSSFNTMNVTVMDSMFSSCTKLEKLLLSPLFNTSKVTDMHLMFDSCDLRTLDVSSFYTSNVKDMRRMFAYNKNLETIKVSNNFVTTGVTDSSLMFSGSTNLTGGKGTKYKIDHVDAEYARIDQGPDSEYPGYFS